MGGRYSWRIGWVEMMLEQIAVASAGDAGGTGVDLYGAIAGKSMGDELLAGGQIEAADRLFYPWHQGRARAEFINAEADQEGGEFDITRQFTADTDPDPCCMGCVHDRFEDTRDRGVGCVMKMRDAFIPPIGGHEILEQIIGANAEEFHFLG